MFIPGLPLHHETQRHVSRMGTRQNDHVAALDALIRGLHDAELWDTLTSLCVVAPTAADSLLDLKDNQDSGLVGSPVFVANRGFTTVSTTDYLTTNLTLDGTHDNDSSLSAYTRVAPGGAVDGALMGERYSSSGPLYVDLWSMGVDEWLADLQAPLGARITSAKAGFRLGSRVNANKVVICVDEKVDVQNVASGSWSLGPHTALFVGCLNVAGVPTSPVANQYAHWSVGHGMQAADALAYDALIKAYMTARGAAV